MTVDLIRQRTLEQQQTEEELSRHMLRDQHLNMSFSGIIITVRALLVSALEKCPLLNTIRRSNCQKN